MRSHATTYKYFAKENCYGTFLQSVFLRTLHNLHEECDRRDLKGYLDSMGTNVVPIQRGTLAPLSYIVSMTKIVYEIYLSLQFCFLSLS